MRLFLTLLLMTLLCLSSTRLWARDRGDRDASEHQQHERNRDSGIDADQAAAIARQDSGGRVLSLKQVMGPEGPAYRVKILRDGRVRVFYVDARDGRLMRP